MCTLILAHGADPDYPVIVGANRDESFHRPSSPPSIHERAGMRILAPTDERAGGTWLGVNEAGVFCGITNGFGPPTDPDRCSRGELVFRAIEEPTAAEAAAAIGEVSAGDYNAFHLVIADPQQAHLVVSDGDLLTATELQTDIAVITERSFGAADNRRKVRARRMVLAARERGDLDVEALQTILTERDSESINAICVTLPGIDYGTRSSTILRLAADGGGEMWHAEGPPHETEYEDMSDLLADVYLSGQTTI